MVVSVGPSDIPILRVLLCPLVSTPAPSLEASKVFGQVKAHLVGPHDSESPLLIESVGELEDLAAKEFVVGVEVESDSGGVAVHHDGVVHGVA